MARRCTHVTEGKRRMVEFDCALVGLDCETQSDGSIGCGPDDQGIARPPAAAPRAAQPRSSFSSIEENVFIDPGEPLPAP